MSRRPSRHAWQATVALAVACCAWASATVAQDVVRCEGPDRQVTYANTECPSGTTAVRRITPPEAPSEAARKAAQERAEHNAKTLLRIERERQQAEEKAERERLASAKKEQAKLRACAKLERDVREAKLDVAQAAPGKRAAEERKLRRAQAAYDDADCS